MKVINALEFREKIGTHVNDLISSGDDYFIVTNRVSGGRDILVVKPRAYIDLLKASGQEELAADLVSAMQNIGRARSARYSKMGLKSAEIMSKRRLKN